MLNPILPTGTAIASMLRQIIKDYNFWGESESDSPLTISRKKSFTDAQLFSSDASMRRKIGGIEYKMPDRTITSKTLLETFDSLVNNNVAEVASIMESIKAIESGIEDLRRPVEALEYYVQLYSIFSSMTNPRVVYVDAHNDPYVGLFIIGEVTGESVIAQALLVQT